MYEINKLKYFYHYEFKKINDVVIIKFKVFFNFICILL